MGKHFKRLATGLRVLGEHRGLRTLAVLSLLLVVGGSAPQFAQAEPVNTMREPVPAAISEASHDTTADDMADIHARTLERQAHERAARQAAQEARRKAAERLAYLQQPGYGTYGGHPGTGPSGTPANCDQYTHNMYWGCTLLLRAGFSLNQMPCLKKLWQGESEWDERAVNPSSKAWGIAQAWPGNKMASAGADWRTNPITQMRWGIGYIRGNYGTPCTAWNFWDGQSPHWY